jgi:hypothetical protein
MFCHISSVFVDLWHVKEHEWDALSANFPAPCFSPWFSCFATRWLWLLKQADSKSCWGSRLATHSSLICTTFGYRTELKAACDRPACSANHHHRHRRRRHHHHPTIILVLLVVVCISLEWGMECWNVFISAVNLQFTVYVICYCWHAVQRS